MIDLAGSKPEWISYFTNKYNGTYFDGHRAPKWQTRVF
ncbi:protein of unknown function [Methylocella tundrae]|uniref:Uncharacterized protein n=1 Tax=Methylocella tundrae TaxID=227605 RepID=A0A4U8Z3F4_METTU|nr:protein of unknown function [Methylocella tundrae]